jgi:serine protease
MLMRTHFLNLYPAALAALLTACGGGGGGGTPNTLPVAALTATPTAGVAALLVDFDGSSSTDSDGSVAVWAWNFGDGGSASGTTAQHTYSAAGTYTATLTVTDDDGATDTQTATITVAANTLPTAAFTRTPASGNGPLLVQFDGNTASDSDGSITAWQWNFGDGSANGSGATVQHTYGSTGVYTATLTVTDDKGGTDTQTATITVTANAPPVAIINADTVEGFAPLTVRFDGRASSDSDGSVASYLWNLGNGSPAAIAAPTALYNTPGEYTTQLTVTDNSGATAVTTTTVYVAATTDTFALAGGFSVPDTAFADCDTAGNGAASCNFGAANAQAIQSPATVGGHAALATDFADDFNLSFAGGETISLAVASNNAPNDLDLKLYEAGGTVLVSQSSGPGVANERLTVPAAGNYMIRVQAAGGASNYILSIGSGTAVAGAENGAFADGEFIAHFSQLRIPWRIDAQREARGAELGMQVLGGDADTPMLLRDPNAARQGARTFRQRLDSRMSDTLTRLRRHPDVAWVELNRVRQALALDATDTYYPLQWNLPLAHFPGAWSIDTQRGSNSIVAVIDTGILATHPDLSGRLVDGYDFVSEADNANDGNGRDANPADPGGDGVGRSIFHGTHVAGIVAANAQFSAAGGNSGMAGAAPLAKVMPLRAVGRYGGLSYDLAQAVRFAAGLSNDSLTLPAQRADVINMSLGSTGYSQTEQNAITAARAAGVIVVAAGGNSGNGSVIYPAGYAGVVGVGAVTLDKRRASYSNTGTHIDLVAPGGDNKADLDGNGFPDGILGTLANDSSGVAVAGYDFYQGTSMAAPHVAAVAAMMKAVSPSLTPAVFDSLLASGALTRDLGAGGRDDEFGMGLLDAEKALVATGAVSASAALAVASPARVGLGATATQALIVIDNGGGGSLSISNVTGNAAWLSVAAQSVDSNGLGSYLVSIDRTSLASGTYSGNVAFTTSAGNVSVPVTMVVSAAVQTNGVGTLYVIVWDPVAAQTVAGSAALPGTSGTFNLGDVIAGNYQVYVGTDNDNDNLICDPGEACGAWLSLQEPKRFAHARARTNLSFDVGFTNNLGTLSTGTATGTLPARGFPRRP